MTLRDRIQAWQLRNYVMRAAGKENQDTWAEQHRVLTLANQVYLGR